jgi:hypothetical protein
VVDRTVVVLGEDESDWEKLSASWWAASWRADSTLGLIMDWLE